MRAVNCATVTFERSDAAVLEIASSVANCRLHGRAVQSVPEMRKVMNASARRSDLAVLVAIADQVCIRWEWLCDTVGAAIIFVETHAASLVLVIDGRDPVAGLVAREYLASLGSFLPRDPNLDAEHHGMIVANVVPRVSDNPLVSLAPVALIFPAFAECLGLP
jgi:hypothetical protein